LAQIDVPGVVKICTSVGRAISSATAVTNTTADPVRGIAAPALELATGPRESVGPLAV
jgi:hypothetical protein